MLSREGLRKDCWVCGAQSEDLRVARSSELSRDGGSSVRYAGRLSDLRWVDATSLQTNAARNGLASSSDLG